MGLFRDIAGSSAVGQYRDIDSAAIKPYTPIGYIDMDEKEVAMTRKAVQPSIILWGWTLSLFLLLSYVLCIVFGLLVPASMHMHKAWAPLLPGFEWLTFTGFLAGAVGSFAYGWYIAIVVIPIKRWISGKMAVNE
tara:strand:- start:68878 stop:69282 length:405 start_codon:yes stop_codon:yes gene_type:complete